MLKKIAAVLVLVLGFAGCHKAHAAEPIQVTIAGINFVLPMQQVGLIQMLDVKSRNGFTGASTTLIAKGDYEVSGGAAAGYSNHENFPFVALQWHFTNKFANIETVRFGPWCGFDASQPKNHVRWGIAASIPLWR